MLASYDDITNVKYIYHAMHTGRWPVQLMHCINQLGLTTIQGCLLHLNQHLVLKTRGGASLWIAHGQVNCQRPWKQADGQDGPLGLLTSQGSLTGYRQMPKESIWSCRSQQASWFFRVSAYASNQRRAASKPPGGAASQLLSSSQEDTRT